MVLRLSAALPGCVVCAAASAQPSDDVRMIRLKISAGDLPSAESILEVHREEEGEDAARPSRWWTAGASFGAIRPRA